jgi:hypothetical protein
LGGVIQEDFSYTLANSQSKFELTLVFRDNHFSQFVLDQREGFPNFPPLYTQPQSSDPLNATRALIQRYSSVMNDSYISEASRLLTTANDTVNDQTMGNTKLSLSTFGSSAIAQLMYTENGTDFAGKRMNVKFENRIISEFSDDWFLFKIGNAQVNISKDQAILAVKEAAKSFTWNVNGTQVSNFQVLDNPVSAELVSHTIGTDSLTLYPYWYVTLHLDKTYQGGVSTIAAGVWADSGKVENMQALAAT